jgi:hypothetical protein
VLCGDVRRFIETYTVHFDVPDSAATGGRVTATGYVNSDMEF